MSDADTDQKKWWQKLFQRNPKALKETLQDMADGDDDDLGSHERMLVQNILKISDLTVADAMVPRADIVAVSDVIDLRQLMQVFIGSGHSRLPVYKGTLDHVVGVIHLRDFMMVVQEQKPFRLTDVVTPVLTVAPSMRPMDLLLRMRMQKKHLALVVDEFGGVDGLITIEDLIEEIVGEIDDEHDDRAEPEVIVQSGQVMVADARVYLEDISPWAGPVLAQVAAENEVDTLGGLVVALAGHVPARGEILKYNNMFQFEILDADPRRVKKVRIRKVVG